MKKVLLIVASVLAAGLSAYAQGTLDFSTKNSGTTPPINAPIVDVSGAKLDGTAGWAQIFAGPANAAESALVAQGSPVNFRTGAAAGYISGGVVTLTGLDFGSTIAVQIRAWNAAAGTTWAGALASTAAGAATGKSAIFSVTLPAPSSPPPLPTPLLGLASQGFALSANAVIPEPTTIALGLLGAALL